MKKLKPKMTGNETVSNTSNAGSGDFNQGCAQDPEYNKGIPVSDEEKRTGKPSSKLPRQNQNAEEGSNQ